MNLKCPIDTFPIDNDAGAIAASWSGVQKVL